MALIDSIKEARDRKGFSNQELARQLGVSPSVLSRVMNEQRPMRLPFLRAVARLMPELKWQVAEYVLNYEVKAK